MALSCTEQRRYHRVIFKGPRKIAALISLLDKQEAATASILNLSEGGIQMSLNKPAANGLRQGQSIMLHCISGLPDLVDTLAEVPMQIIWVIDNEFLDHLLFGTAFATLSDLQQQSLRSFVDTCLKKAS